ncbi:uncharacterized protein AMSG_03860 [Thecamonas trahens ATCC 50062]|uniref:Uncharacterized protein n=1 Tax=Thecamonas trahens ATCC 50062 TaxID=461836 RepID=A0A0L0D4X8_THETB|nr:hypothetical protein AMSG_03860 [Thecamonas trahens ATCC 50062]KNC47427.1 hypothetical protein AMSG_03860 [Thecamonas trahens ATCC 50062]|eukprot:XP_013759763.1 hypothetical protein AMSG_03860 [Thecamonas trahens ATCC 50062]
MSSSTTSSSTTTTAKATAATAAGNSASPNAETVMSGHSSGLDGGVGIVNALNEKIDLLESLLRKHHIDIPVAVSVSASLRSDELAALPQDAQDVGPAASLRLSKLRESAAPGVVADEATLHRLRKQLARAWSANEELQAKLAATEADLFKERQVLETERVKLAYATASVNAATAAGTAAADSPTVPPPPQAQAQAPSTPDHVVVAELRALLKDSQAELAQARAESAELALKLSTATASWNSYIRHELGAAEEALDELNASQVQLQAELAEETASGTELTSILSAELAETTQQLAQLGTAHADAVAQLESSQAELASLREELASVIAIARKYAGGKRKVSAALKESRAANDSLVAELKAARTRLAHLEAELGDADAVASAARSAADRDAVLVADAAEMKRMYGPLQAALDSRAKDLAAANEALAVADARIAALDSDAAKRELAILELEKANHSLELLYSSIKNELSATKLQLAEAQETAAARDAAAADAVAAADAKIADLSAQLTSVLDDATAEFKDRTTALQGAADAAAVRAAAASAANDDLRDQLEASNDQLAAALAALTTLESQCLQLASPMDDAVHTLKSQLATAHTAQAAASSRVAHLLAERKSAAAALEDALDANAQLEAAAAAAVAATAAHERDLATIRADLAAAKHSLASVEDDKTKLGALNAQLSADLRAEQSALAAEKNEVALATAALRAAKDDAASLRAELDAAKADAAAKAADAASAHAALARAEAALSVAEAGQSSLSSQVADLSPLRTQLESAIMRATSAEAELAALRASSAARPSVPATALDDVHAELAALTKKHALLRARLASADDAAAAKDAELAALQADCTALRNALRAAPSHPPDSPAADAWKARVESLERRVARPPSPSPRTAASTSASASAHSSLLDAANDRIASLQEMLADTQATAARVPELEAEVERLTRWADTLSSEKMGLVSSLHDAQERTRAAEAQAGAALLAVEATEAALPRVLALLAPDAVLPDPVPAQAELALRTGGIQRLLSSLSIAAESASYNLTQANDAVDRLSKQLAESKTVVADLTLAAASSRSALTQTSADNDAILSDSARPESQALAAQNSMVLEELDARNAELSVLDGQRQSVFEELDRLLQTCDDLSRM